MSGTSSVGKSEFLESVVETDKLKIVKMSARSTREKYNNPSYQTLLQQPFYKTAEYQSEILSAFKKVVKSVKLEDGVDYIFERSPLDVVAYSEVFIEYSVEASLGFDLSFWLLCHKKSALNLLTNHSKIVYFNMDLNYPYVEDVHRPPVKIREQVDRKMAIWYKDRENVISKQTFFDLIKA
jgi:hypothetical protein